jgi:hypothetical protein
MGQRRLAWKCGECKRSALSLRNALPDTEEERDSSKYYNQPSLTPAVNITGAHSDSSVLAGNLPVETPPIDALGTGSSTSVSVPANMTSTDIMLLLTSLQADFSKILNEFQTLKSSIQSTNEKMDLIIERSNLVESKLNLIDEIDKRIKTGEERLSSLETAVESLEERSRRESALEDEIISLKTTVQELTNENNNREQYQRSNNMEISGVPVTVDESPIDIVKNIALKLNVPLNDSDIVFSRRVSSWSNQKKEPPKIVVKLNNRDIVDCFIQAVRKNKGLTTKILNYNGVSRNVFLNYHLTPNNKRLFKKVRERAEFKQYDFCWIKRCCIYVRKNSSSDAIMIKTDTDLSKIL